VAFSFWAIRHALLLDNWSLLIEDSNVFQ